MFSISMSKLKIDEQLYFTAKLFEMPYCTLWFQRNNYLQLIGSVIIGKFVMQVEEFYTTSKLNSDVRTVTKIQLSLCALHDECFFSILIPT